MENLELKTVKSRSYRNFVYLLFRDDAYKFPECVTDNLHEMSYLTGISYDKLCHSLYRGVRVNKVYMVERLDIRDPEERFNYVDYIQYCKVNELKPTSFASLEKFKKFIYGEI